MCPIDNNSVVNSLNNLYLQRHTKETGGDIKSLNMDFALFLYEIIICDEDTVGFLRDLAKPFIVAYILYTGTDIVFYKNSRIQKRAIAPPRKDKLLKDIYWNAVQCESNLKR